MRVDNDEEFARDVIGRDNGEPARVHPHKNLLGATVWRGNLIEAHSDSD
ncbi:hypothetical protein [Tardiphaga sp.]|nr:hypothetical protein [Tardiphaga sp.]